VITGPVEATALGNLLTQVKADGELGSLAEMRAVVEKSAEVETLSPASNLPWDEAAERFARLRSS
jgi:hypothetical protein